MKNYFVYGMSGSGKDTVSNYLRDDHFYLKLRIADTIKRIICEAKNLSFVELEEQKRIDKTLRDLHNTVSGILDDVAGKKQSSLNRLEQLINGKALDYQHFDLSEIGKIPKIVCDVRTFEEADMLLEADWVGLFLSRTTGEYKDSNHFTEQNMFINGNLRRLQEKYVPSLIHVIFNNDSNNAHEYNLLPEFESITNYHKTNGTDQALYNVILRIISNK